MIVGAGFPDNGLGLESPATFQSERTFGKRSDLLPPCKKCRKISFGYLSMEGIDLSEITHARCKDRLDLGSGNIFRDVMGVTFGVGHFSEHAAAG